VLVYDADVEMAAQDRDNRRKRSGQFAVSWALIAAERLTSGKAVLPVPDIPPGGL